MKDFHGNFDKTINGIRVVSCGGGSPRWGRIEGAEGNLSMEQMRDLKYMIERLLELHG